MKLFQIEEPEGPPLDADGPGAAVGIDWAPEGAAVAVALGGNAEILPGSDGERTLAVAGFDAAGLATTFAALRSRAEKQLARPVTHAVVASSGVDQAALEAAAEVAELTVLRHMTREAAAALGEGDAALGAAIQAEDDAAAVLPR